MESGVKDVLEAMKSDREVIEWKLGDLKDRRNRGASIALYAFKQHPEVRGIAHHIVEPQSPTPISRVSKVDDKLKNGSTAAISTISQHLNLVQATRPGSKQDLLFSRRWAPILRDTSFKRVAAASAHREQMHVQSHMRGMRGMLPTRLGISSQGGMPMLT